MLFELKKQLENEDQASWDNKENILDKDLQSIRVNNVDIGLGSYRKPCRNLCSVSISSDWSFFVLINAQVAL